MYTVCCPFLARGRDFVEGGTSQAFVWNQVHSHLKGLLILGGNDESLFKGYNSFSLTVYMLFSS
jgi:hypothetical protein